MPRIGSVFFLASCVIFGLSARTYGQTDEKEVLARYQAAAMAGGDPGRGKVVFESKEAACRKCHAVGQDERLAGPDLKVIGDKFRREQLVQSVLEPSASIHPDHATLVVRTGEGKVYAGVLRKRTAEELQMLDAEGALVRVPVKAIEEEQRSGTSLMPVGLHKILKVDQFADLIAYLEALKQTDSGVRVPGLPNVILPVEKPVRLVPMHTDSMRFDHPVCVIAIPGRKHEFVVVEQKTRKIWRFVENAQGNAKELFADLSAEATTGEFEGVVCLAFHPQFVTNRKYYVNYHVRNQGSHFSPVIVERQASADLQRDAGLPSRRILQIPQETDLHWGGMIAFGPDGFLYIGAGDAGPQEDPEGHSQDMSLLTGKILRIDVDHKDEGKAYAIPESNPFRNAGPKVRPEIWASGYRMPWRFSFDPPTKDLWVGEIGQYLFEEVSIARVGENHGWNVFEAFVKFSDQYRREGEKYTPPVFSYRREQGVSVTGGYVYRGQRNPSYVGAYIFGDFESKHLWALTQVDRQLTNVRRIGNAPQRISSFGIDAEGEILVVGYDGTIYRMDLEGSDFGATATKTARVKLLRDGTAAAARVAILGCDDQPYAPAEAPLRKTTAGESYFYTDGSFAVSLPPGRSRLTISGGLESLPQTVDLDTSDDTELELRLASWIDLAERGWYSGDSHVHLHTGGPIAVNVADALVAARAEGVNFVNLCVSNNVGDDIRDRELITGKPHSASTDRHLLVFGEEMRSMIYGHMQFFGIQSLVEPQYTGFDETPNHLDFPANFQMAAETIRQGGVVTYGHPLFTGQPYPFEDDLAKPNGAARELPIDAILGMVQAIDLMSYNSDEPLSTELWYRLLNCGLKLAACVGTDALLDRSTDPLGGDRVYVKIAGPLTMESWLDGLKSGRTFVTNGPIPMLEVERKGPGETCALAQPGSVRVAGTVESLVPFNKVEVILNGEVVAEKVVTNGETMGVKTARIDVAVPIARSSWIAVRVRGPASPLVFDGPAWAHTSPVFVTVAGQPIRSRRDAEFFVEWIEQMTRVLGARNRFAKPEDRRQVETLFRKAQEEFRKRAKED